MEKNISQYYESLLLFKNTSLPQKSIFVHHENKSIFALTKHFQNVRKNHDGHHVDGYYVDDVDNDGDINEDGYRGDADSEDDDDDERSTQESFK